MNPICQKICVIGGGPAGISLGRELGEAGIDYDLYEAEADFGGVWNTGADCGRVYSSAHLISPKSNTQFPDFPMPDHYPDYPNHRLMLDYIRAYATEHGVYERAIFNTRVKRITPDEGAWQVSLASGAVKQYSVVYVCNGAQRIPRLPEPAYPGSANIESIHSMEYRSAEQLRGKRVLIIGAGNSGCDIAIDAAHHADKAYLSMRRAYYFQPKFIDGLPTPEWMMQQGNKFKTREETLAYIVQVFKLAGFDGSDFGLKKPDYPLDACHPIMNSQVLYHIGHGDIIVKDDVKAVDEKGVAFVDGSHEPVDLIIYATGYRPDFSLLEADHLTWKDGQPELFLHMMPREFDNLFFHGYYNLAGGLGNVVKIVSQLAVAYVRARRSQSEGFKRFMLAKAEDRPDLGRSYFLNSARHLWEVDMWKFISVLNQYRAMLNSV